MMIVTGYYGIKAMSGDIAMHWFIVYCIVGWAEFLTGVILLKAKGKAASQYDSL